MMDNASNYMMKIAKKSNKQATTIELGKENQK